MGGAQKTRPEAALKTRQEAAAWLGVRSSTLAAWAAEGRGPAFVRLILGSGKRPLVRYPVKELEAFVESGMVRPKAE